MSKLISGKEALIALANGEEVEHNAGMGWQTIRADTMFRVSVFISGVNSHGYNVEFRLKPKTINIDAPLVQARSIQRGSNNIVKIELKDSHDTHLVYDFIRKFTGFDNK